jgi:hypothetical protein
MRIGIAARVTVIAALAVAASLAVSAPASASGTASISGTVRSAATGTPDSGVTVELIGTVNTYFGPGPEVVDTTSTAADGTYSFTGLGPDDYYQVCFDATGDASADEAQCYNAVSWFLEPGDIDPIGFITVPGQYIPVTDGQQVTGIDASMVVAATITGKATDATTGDPLNGATVTIGNDSYFTQVSTAADGTYSAKVPADPSGYQVCFSDGNAYASTCVQTAAVTTSQQLSGVDAALGPNTTAISGTVRLADTGKVAAGVGVTLFFLDGGTTEYGQPIGQVEATTTTATNGTYSFQQLPQDNSNYDVCFTPSSAQSKYAAQCYFNTYWGTTTGDSEGQYTMPSSATNVSPTPGQSLAGINASLGLPSITGTVTQSPLGAPLAGVNVDILGPSATILATTTTNKKGMYSIAYLHSTDYYVCFDGSAATGGTTLKGKGYLDQCWRNIKWSGTGKAPAGCTAVHPVATKTLTGINAALRAAV